MKLQVRTKSVVWWIGLAACVYQAVTQAASAAGVALPWYVGAVGVALAAVLVYCNGNNPTNPAGY